MTGSSAKRTRYAVIALVAVLALILTYGGIHDDVRFATVERGMTSRNPHLDALIASTPGWKGEMVARLRAAIHAADPEIVETWKWVSAKRPGTPCFEHDGIVCHINVLKERVRLTMRDGAQLPDPRHLFNANLDGSQRRGIDWYAGDPFDTAAVEAIVRAGVGARQAQLIR